MEQFLVILIIGGIPAIIFVTSIFKKSKTGEASKLFQADPHESKNSESAAFRGYVASGTFVFVMFLLAMLFRGCN